MLPKLLPNQKVFVEITNPVHGGEGWKFGTCLWSPQKDNGGAAAWKLMEEINPGDIIIHFLKLRIREYFLYGFSIADSKLIKTNDRPPNPGKWDKGPYQRINLGEFKELNTPVSVKEIFDAHRKELIKILDVVEQRQFYVLDKNDLLKMQQAYIVACENSLYVLLNKYFAANETGAQEVDVIYKVKADNKIVVEETEETENEPTPSDIAPPGKKDAKVSRFIRDTKLSRTLKKKHQWKCQVCGEHILLPSKNLYAEGHHIQPLGNKHNGLDVKGNILIVCPNHHAEFDYGSIAINPGTMKIEHVDETNRWHGKKLAYNRADIDKMFLEYHYEMIFKKL
ncbi:MAG: HNH endonuclease [Bacteroidetes bacterium]|nr:HNH endonuclease [Bacteroidota bacterium]